MKAVNFLLCSCRWQPHTAANRPILPSRRSSRLKNLLQVGGVGAEILLHIARVLRVTRALDDQPAAPAHVVQCLFDLRQVEPLVVLKPYAVLVRAVNLADAVLAERAQFTVQIAPGL